jgi:Rho family protein
MEEMRSKGLQYITKREGEEMRESTGARKYLECSSLTGEGVDDVFEAATRAAMIMGDKGEHGGAGCCVVL